MISKILDRSREAHRWARVDNRVAATARTMLERTALKTDTTQAVADFLRRDLNMTEVEARGRAPEVLRDVAGATGLLMKEGPSWSFTSLPVLIHFAACA